MKIINRFKSGTLFMPVLLAICLLMFLSCSRATGQTDVGIPNPAADFCEELGYKWELKAKGDESVGTCVFPDGTDCEAWEFYRGECGAKFSKCAKEGYTLKTVQEDMDGWTAKYAVCVFDDKSECLETEYKAGMCGRSDCKKWIASKGGCLKYLAETKELKNGSKKGKNVNAVKKKEATINE